MTQPPRFRSVVLTVFTGVALLAAMAAATAEAAAGDAEPGAEGRRTALVVFVSYRGNVSVPVHPTLVRLAADERLAAALGSEGRSVVAASELEPLMRRHRLRSERDLSLSFLQDLSREFSVDELVVAKLVTYDDRIVLLGRALSTESGWLRWANVAEGESDVAAWSDEVTAADRLDSLVEAAARQLLPAETYVPTDEDTEGLITLPLASSGLGRGDSDLATLCLLRALLRSGRWHIPDPALVVDEMQRGGFDPFLLGARARQLLVSGFSSQRLLVPTLTSFPAAAGPGGGAPIAAFDDFDAPASAASRQPPVLFTLALIDGESGQLVAGHAEYLKPDDNVGLFGKARHARLSRRFEEGTDLLVRSLMEEKGSS